MSKLFIVNNCQECPNCIIDRTPGAGYALDYMCKANNKKIIAGYVEHTYEEPQNGKFPKWCPLKDSNEAK
jgi:hypothetical protein